LKGQVDNALQNSDTKCTMGNNWSVVQCSNLVELALLNPSTSDTQFIHSHWQQGLQVLSYRKQIASQLRTQCRRHLW